MQTSVQSAQKMSLRRPVACTAATKSVSSHELTLVRSIGGLSSSNSASSGTVGCCWPDATLTVEWTIGSPNALDVFTVRSEEHTSELQSLRHLVCRLLL